MKTTHDMSALGDINPMDRLLAKLSEQQAVLNKQNEALDIVTEDIAYKRTVEYVASTANQTIPLATTPLSTTPLEVPSSTPTSTQGDDAPAQPANDEVLRLKLELEKAQGKIAHLDQELNQTRIAKHTIEQVIGSASEADFPLFQSNDITDHRLSNFQNALNGPVGMRPQLMSDDSWDGREDTRSEHSEALSAGGFNRANAIWANANKQGYVSAQTNGAQDFQQQPSAYPANPWMARGMSGQLPSDTMSAYGQSIPGFRNDRLASDNDAGMAPGDRRNNNNRGRFGGRAPAAFPYAGSNSSYDGIAPTPPSYGSMAGIGGGFSNAMGAPMGLNMNSATGYQPQPIGTPLSPFAPEFTSISGQWKNEVSHIYLEFHYIANIHRPLLRKVKPSFQLPNRSTIVVSWTEPSTATGNILSTKSFATMISRHLSSCSRSSR
jgi:hypothetical protein